MARSDPPDKFLALERVQAALADGTPVPDPEAKWLSAAIERFLAVEGSSLTKEMGLRPRRGGARETVWALQWQHRRDRLIKAAAAGFSGTDHRKARELARLIHDCRKGETPENAPPEVAELVKNFDGKLPSSPMQFTRILAGETITARRPISSYYDYLLMG